MAFKATGAQTGGAFSLMERNLPPGVRRPPAHRHGSCTEGYFVLDGIVEVELDGSPVAVAPGEFLLVPRGMGHTFGNNGPLEARLLVLHAPALDGYFEELQSLWSGQPPTKEDEQALMARFGMEPA